MSKAHQRRKQPEVVRQQVLEVAARLSLQKGPASVTLDAVSQAAGVSKGGLLHHFPSKQALLDGMFDDLVGKFGQAIDEEMARHPAEAGRFTRAYLAVCFSPEHSGESDGWKTLVTALLAEPHLRQRWRLWALRQAERHAATDGSVDAELVRFAVDGLWLSQLLDGAVPGPERQRALMERLIALSRL